ncbi:dipeptide epimerase [Ectobacillus sp. JY-23]|uniref:dipeptide epimerase n=1 Tax=Ectobacillus sp. JY-23 TaxID=2933872 RepID=UPI001FF4D2FA|nr:dipeptide epimerase [Ectobacillus sp. JY-23]UOY92533.1 dipeptide epimerase [Ectobacillus sp. JY-23]
MKITDIKVTRRLIPLRKPFKTALRTATEIENVEVAIHTDAGIIGKGSAAPTPVITGDFASGIEEALQGPIRAVLLGKDVADFQMLLTSIQSSCIGNTSAKAAADMALHDLYCRSLGVSLSMWLGGRKKIRTDMTVGVDTPSVMAQEAATHVQNGFDKLKVKVGMDAALDLERITAIKEQVPSHIQLRLDANQGWTPREAVALIREMEARELGIELVEQPVHAKDWEGLKYVTERVNTPIMADESIFSAADAMKLVQGRYVDLLNIKLMKCGGIREAWRIADIAQTAGVKCMVGSMMESSLSVAAIAHVAEAHPNIHYIDLDAPLWLSEEPIGISYDGANILLDKVKEKSLS